MTLTNLHNGLHCVEVPEDRDNFYISKLNNVCSKGQHYDMLHCSPEFKYKILGYVTATEVSFDCEPYVERSKGHIESFYIMPNKDLTKDKNKAFRSFIEKETGKSFVNTYGDKPKPDDYDYEVYMLENKFDMDLEQWQQAENNRLKKVIVIKEL